MIPAVSLHFNDLKAEDLLGIALYSDIEKTGTLKTGNAKSVKTILAHPEKYHVHRAVKLGNDYNVGYANGILTLPSYMGFLLCRDTTL